MVLLLTKAEEPRSELRGRRKFHDWKDLRNSARENDEKELA